MTEEDWYQDDPREWELDDENSFIDEEAEIEAIIEVEIDLRAWHTAQGIIDLEWTLESRLICLVCGRSITRESMSAPGPGCCPIFLDDGHGEC
tara:strand:- start:179 stop:457 length:279 start_codon:yes stop_codon:yes gene_type:complete